MRKTSFISISLLAILSFGCKKGETPFTGPVKANFETETTDVTVGDPVEFLDLSTGNISRWNWEFEGGVPETSNLSCPQVQWMEAGTYGVKLTVANVDSSDEIVREGYITVGWTTQISADFSVDRTSATNIDEICFTDLSTGYPNKWEWIIAPESGTPVTSSLQNPSLTLDPGVYSVTLKASNPVVSDTKTVSSLITVIDKDAVFAAVSAECRTTYAGGSIKFKDTSLGKANAWQWEFEGGTPATSTAQNPVVKYDAPGKYKVKMTATGAVTSSSITEEGFIHVIPADRLVFFLPFDGDLSDHGPNGIAVTPYELGGFSTGFSDPHPVGSVTDFGQSLYFPGGTKGQTYSVLQVSDNLANFYPTGSDFTVSLWVKAAASSDAMAFFAQGSCPGVLSQGNNQAWARFQSGTAGIRLCVESYQGDGNTVTSSTQYDDGQWHHVAFVYETNGDGTRNAFLYVDGSSQGSAKNKPDKQIDTTPYFIGCNLRLTNSAWAPENMMKGSIDNYILYSRALTASEVAELYEY